MRSALCGNGALAIGSFPRISMYSTPRIALMGENSESVIVWTSSATSRRYASASLSMRVSLPVQYITTEGCRLANAMIEANSGSDTKFGDSMWTAMPSSSVASRYSTGGTNVWKRTKLKPNSLRFRVTMR